MSPHWVFQCGAVLHCRERQWEPYPAHLLSMTGCGPWQRMVSYAVLAQPVCVMGAYRVQTALPRRGRLSDASLETSLCFEGQQ